MSNQVATKAVSYRLPLSREAGERFGITGSEWKVLTEVVFPMAQAAESILLALSYCKARHLDVMKKPCHIVPMWSSKENRYVDTIWPGVSELRTTATRTGAYGGAEPTNFGPPRKHTFKGQSKPRGNKPAKSYEATIEFPEFAQITVYRLVQGQKLAFPGPRVVFLETYSKISNNIDVPNDKWQRSPSYMLEKCAEAAALRRAFPEEIGDDHSWEEMEGKDIIDVVPKAEPRPSRADVEGADEGDAGDPPVVEEAASSGTAEAGGAAPGQFTAGTGDARDAFPEDDDEPVEAAAEAPVEQKQETPKDGPFEVLKAHLGTVRDQIAKIDFPGDLSKIKEETKARITATKGLSEDERSALFGLLASIFLDRQREIKGK
jgi:phage recombination protein Bet